MIIHNAIPAQPGDKIPGYIGMRCGCGNYLLVPEKLPKDHFVECTQCRRRFRASIEMDESDSRKKSLEDGKTGKKPWRIFQWLQILKDKLIRMLS